MSNRRRTFTRRSTAETVRRVTEPDHRLAEVGRDLEIGECTLATWKQAIAAESEEAFPGKGHPPALKEELRRLRSEAKRLTIEHEIPRKATAFLARESS